MTCACIGGGNLLVWLGTYTSGLTQQASQELSGSVDTILYSTEMLSLDPENRKKQILVTGSAGFYCLYDGTAWKKCENSRLEAAASAKITASYMPTGNTIVLSTENGKIFRSKNSGSLFEAVATTSIDQKWPSGIKVNRMFGERPYTLYR